MKNLLHTQTSIASQIIVGVAVLGAIACISLALHQSGNANNHPLELGADQVPQVVIVGHRMTADQKLAYDLAPTEVARVEIIGRRFSAEEKLALTEAGQMSGRQTVQHRKS